MCFVWLFVLLWVIWNVIYTSYHYYAKSFHSFGASCIITPRRNLQTKLWMNWTTWARSGPWQMLSRGNKNKWTSDSHTERYVVNDIALCNMGVRAGKSTHNTRIEQTTVSERKDFRFCICVCRCASHVSSGYEPQFVFPMHASCESYGPDVCFLWVLCCFNLVSLMLLSLMLLQSSVCGSYWILRRLAMSNSLGSSVRYPSSLAPGSLLPDHYAGR